MYKFIKRCDLFGQPVCFFLKGRHQHETFFGGVLTVFTAIIKIIVVIIFASEFFGQEPQLRTTFAYTRDTNKKERFTHLNFTAIIERGDGLQDDGLFGKYFRVLLDQGEKLSVYRMSYDSETRTYLIDIPLPLDEIYGDQENARLREDSIRVLDCEDVLSEENAIYITEGDKEECKKYRSFESYLKESKELGLSDDFNFKYFSDFSYLEGNYKEDKSLSVKTEKREHLFSFKLRDMIKFTYSLEKTFLHILDDRTLFSVNKNDTTYINFGDLTLQSMEKQQANDFEIEILINDEFRTQVVTLTVTKNKFLAVLGQLGGIIHILSYFSIIPKLWNEYYYQRSIIRILINNNEEEMIKIDKTMSNQQSSGSLIPKSTEGRVPLVNKKIMQQEKEDWRFVTYCQWLKSAFCGRWVQQRNAIEQTKKLKDVFSLEYYLERLRVIRALVDINEERMNTISLDIAKNNPVG